MSESDAKVERAVLTADTTADAERAQIEAWRRMSPVAKARLVSQITQATLHLASIGIQHRYPTASGRERFLRLAALKLGPALVRTVYPDAAHVPGIGR